MRPSVRFVQSVLRTFQAIAMEYIVGGKIRTRSGAVNHLLRVASSRILGSMSSEPPYKVSFARTQDPD